MDRNDATAMAYRLYEVTEAHRKLQNEERELKAYFKERLQTHSASVFDSIVVSSMPKARSFIDAELVRSYLGADVAKGLERTTNWTEISVRRIAEIHVHENALEGAAAAWIRRGSK